MIYNCLIVDDEPIARKILIEYIEEFADLKVIGQLNNAIGVTDFLNKNKVDILFLDINMPKLTGIQLLQDLKQPPLVIFTTAYAEYAVNAFELEAFDYLVKPIAFDRFLKAINKAKRRLEEQQSTINLSKLFTIKENKRIYNVSLEEIYLVQAYGDYIRIYTTEKTYITKEKFTHLKESLPSNFLQVHRSYIINIQHLKYLEGNQVVVQSEKIPVSATYREKLKKWL